MLPPRPELRVLIEVVFQVSTSAWTAVFGTGSRMFWITHEVLTIGCVYRRVMRSAVPEIAEQSSMIIRIMKSLAGDAQRDTT
jgi:hypothetical protein